MLDRSNCKNEFTSGSWRLRHNIIAMLIEEE